MEYSSRIKTYFISVLTCLIFNDAVLTILASISELKEQLDVFISVKPKVKQPNKVKKLLCD